MSTRDLILARRARFLAASLATLAGEACTTATHRGDAVDPSHANRSVPSASAASAAASTSASASSDGAARDGDGDGVPDGADACPDRAGASPDGCPRVVAVACLSITIVERPHFAAGSARPIPDAAVILDATADTMKAHPEIEQVTLTGHCDAVEQPCPDRARAEAVRDALVARGVEPLRLAIDAAGRGKPIEANATEEGRAKNRRVELAITKKR